MDHLTLETQRLRSLRAMHAGLIELKWLRDALRFDLAMRTHLFTLKYGYNPNQPRDEIGRWTQDGGLGGRNSELIRLAGEIPTGGLPDIPTQRPPTSRARTAVLKTIARKIGEIGASTLGGIKLEGWLATRRAEIESYRDPPRSLEELQRRAWTPEAGYDKHHIVERNQIDRFSAEVINRPENLVLIPRLKHQEINGWYSTPDPQFGGQSPREYLNGRSLAVQRAVGLEALRRAGVLKP